MSTVVIVSVRKKVGVWKTFREEPSEDVSFGIGTLLVVEQASLVDPPGGVIYAVVYGSLYRVWHVVRGGEAVHHAGSMVILALQDALARQMAT